MDTPSICLKVQNHVDKHTHRHRHTHTHSCNQCIFTNTGEFHETVLDCLLSRVWLFTVESNWFRPSKNAVVYTSAILWFVISIYDSKIYMLVQGSEVMHDGRRDAHFSPILFLWSCHGEWCIENCLQGFAGGNLKERGNLDDLDLDEKVMWNCIFKKQDGKLWTGFVSLRIGTSWWTLVEKQSGYTKHW